MEQRVLTRSTESKHVIPRHQATLKERGNQLI